MKRLTLPALALLLAVAAPAAARGPSPRLAAAMVEAAANADVVDLVFAGDTRPLRLRLHVRVDGRPHQEVWAEALDKLFNYLDLNGDGRLDKAEAGRAPPVDELRSPVNQRTDVVRTVTGLAQAVVVPDADGDGQVSRSELAAYYRRLGYTPLRLVSGADGGSSGRLTDILYTSLDTNGDGRLSEAELAAATDRLNKLDANDDELIGEDELSPPSTANRFIFTARQAEAPSAADLERLGFLPRIPEVGDTRAAALLRRYDRDRDGLLRATEVGLSEADFRAADVGGDGGLDAADLTRWLKAGADLEIAVWIGNTPAPAGQTGLAGALVGFGNSLGGRSNAVQLVHPSGMPPALAGLASAVPTGVVLKPAGARIDLRLADAPQFALANNQQFLVQQFKAVAGERGFVDKAMADRTPLLTGLFRTADRDGDGKLTEKELVAYLELRDRASTSCSQLAVTEHGRSLFELLDTNGDRQLGVRECRSGWERLREHRRDGAVAKTDLPRRLEVQASRSTAFLNNRFVAVAFAGMPPGRQPSVGPAPLWFQRMDRNGDGDVSRREFLGTEEDFQRLDTDHDGLLDAKEAQAGTERQANRGR